MKFLNFFKKKPQKIEIEEKTINFEEIVPWIKEHKAKNKEQKIFKLIEEEINLMEEGLNKKIKIVEEIDLESKNLEKRINSIIEENLFNYINHIKKFKENINNLNKKNINNFIINLNM